MTIFSFFNTRTDVSFFPSNSLDSQNAIFIRLWFSICSFRCGASNAIRIWWWFEGCTRLVSSTVWVRFIFLVVLLASNEIQYCRCDSIWWAPYREKKRKTNTKHLQSFKTNKYYLLCVLHVECTSSWINNEMRSK